MLTDTACKNAKSTQKPYKLTDSGGLFLLVTPSGAKYWRLNYRYAGRQKTLAIGVYPVVGLGNPTKHMSNNTILKALERMGFKGRMTGHGFRALAMSTIKERIGYRHEVVDRQLAHSPHTKNDAAYDRAKYMDERKKMMQDWADYLDGFPTFTCWGNKPISMY